MNIFLKPSENKEIFFKNKKSFNFNLEKNSFFYAKNIIFDSNNESTMNIHGVLKKKSTFKYVIADFSKKNFSLNININLNEENAKVYIDVFCLSMNSDKKKININLNHENKNIKTIINTSGIAFDNSCIDFTNSCAVKNKCKKNILSQTGKIIVFGDNASAFIKPILKIFANDILASHKASIGCFNNDHFFYLLSRGLKKEDIKKLLINNFLQKIFLFFNKDINNKIIEIVKKI